MEIPFTSSLLKIHWVIDLSSHLLPPDTYIYNLIIFFHVFFTLNGRQNQPTRRSYHPSVPSTPVSFPTQKIVSHHRPRTKSLAATTSHEHQQWPPPGRAPAQSQQTLASQNSVAFFDFGDVGWLDETVNLAVYLQPFSKLNGYGPPTKMMVSPVRCSFSFSRGPFSGAISVFGGVAAFLWWIEKKWDMWFCVWQWNFGHVVTFRPFGRFCFSAASRILHSNDPLRDVRFFLWRIAMSTFPTNWTPGDFRLKKSLWRRKSCNEQFFIPPFFGHQSLEHMKSQELTCLINKYVVYTPSFETFCKQNDARHDHPAFF